MTQPSLTDFLLARLAEDEAVARSAIPGNADDFGRWEMVFFPYEGDWPQPAGMVTTGEVSTADDEGWEGHCTRHDPARVLAGVEASRARLRLADDIEGEADDGTYRWAASIAERIRRIEALPFADHPDYQEAWKP